MRRSNSISNIPMAKTNLFGTRESRTSTVRAQSSTRLTTQRDSIASVSLLPIRRNSSLERRSNNPGLSRLTPLTKLGTTRASSLQRTTPSSTVSQRMGYKGTTPTSGVKDRVTIQKLATNKKWVLENYTRVQNFISTSSLFDPTFLSTNTLKPPSTKTFVFVTATFFKEIFPRREITYENYKEVLPLELKVLHYPGTLTNSLLKTVNTMHSWPQIVGLWSWLITKVKLSQCHDDLEYMDYLEPEERQRFLLKQNCQDLLIKRYEIFNHNNNSTELVQRANNNYVENLSEILDVDFEKFNLLKADVLNRAQHREKQLQEIEQLKAEKQKKQLCMEQMRNEIEEFEQSDAIEEQELKNELQLLQINLKDLRDAKDTVRKNVCRLEEEKKIQPCTYKEKLAMLREIDELRNQNQIKREKIEHARNIKNKFDHDLTDRITRIQNIVIRWNRSLMEMSIEKPELRSLLLREKGFHDPAFLNELQQVSERRTAMENDVAKSLVKVESDLASLEQKKLEVERDIEELDQFLMQRNQECAKLNESIAKVKMDTKDLKVELHEKQQEHIELYQKLREKGSRDLAAQAAEIEVLKERKEKLESEVKTFGMKMVSFFVEMNSQVTSNIREMDAVRKGVLKSTQAKVIKAILEHKELLEALESFNPTQ